jgi:hypothetical protein
MRCARTVFIVLILISTAFACVGDQGNTIVNVVDGGVNNGDGGANGADGASGSDSGKDSGTTTGCAPCVLGKTTLGGCCVQ